MLSYGVLRATVIYLVGYFSFKCGVQNMYPTIFCVKLFPKCHLPPIIRSPRNTSQNFFWTCVYFNTLFKLYTPPRTHVAHKEYYSFTQYPIMVQMSTQPTEYIKCWQKIPQKVIPHKIAVVNMCVCVCVCSCRRTIGEIYPWFHSRRTEAFYTVNRGHMHFGLFY